MSVLEGVCVVEVELDGIWVLDGGCVVSVLLGEVDDGV